MKEPKPAVTPVDTERFVRGFLDAFNSLKTTPAPTTCSWPAEKEQRPAQLQEAREQPFELVGGNALSTDPRPVPWAPREALTGPVSGIDERESEQISAFESAENSKTPDNQTEAKSGQYQILEGFCSEHGIIERFWLTPQELKTLSSAALLGSLTCKQDVQFMLRQVNGARKPANPRVTVPLQPPKVADEYIEPSAPGVSAMAERIRRVALTRLAELDSLRTDPRSPIRRYVDFSSALVLMLAMTRSFIEMMPNLMQHLLPEAGRTLLSGQLLFAASLIGGIYLRWTRSLAQSGGKF
jgi:hypothetical protein